MLTGIFAINHESNRAGVVEKFPRDLRNERGDVRGLGDVHIFAQRLPRHAAVERAGVHIDPAERLRRLARYGGFTRRGGAINRDHGDGFIRHGHRGS